MQFILLHIPSTDGLEIPGETTLADEDSGINILSFSHGLSMPMAPDASGNGRPTGRSNHQNFTVTKYFSLSSPVLNQACARGDNLGQIALTIKRTGETDAQTIKFTMGDAYITSVSMGGGGDGLPIETVTFQYTGIQWEYGLQKEDGSEGGTSTGNWNCETNNDDFSPS